jgi:hypothetical protein
VIAFGVHVASPQVFSSYLAPALGAVAEPDSAVLESDAETAAGAYAEILDACRELRGLEALVLLREDAVPSDPLLPTLLRETFAEPSIAVAGVAGGSHCTGLAWWEATPVGRLRTPQGTLDFGPPAGDVHLVDDLCVALSPWAVASLRLDGSLPYVRHGAAAELCWLTRLAGQRVVVRDLGIEARGPVARLDAPGFLQGDLVFRTRWSSD